MTWLAREMISRGVKFRASNNVPSTACSPSQADNEVGVAVPAGREGAGVEVVLELSGAAIVAGRLPLVVTCLAS